MEDASQRHMHSNHTSSHFTALLYTHLLSPMTLPPWSLHASNPFAPVSTAERSCSSESLPVAGQGRGFDHLDPLSDYDHHIYSDMPTSFFAESYYPRLKPPAIEDGCHEFVESQYFSSPLFDHLETTQESTTGDGPVLDKRGYEIIHQDSYKKGRRAEVMIPPIQYYGFSLDCAYKREYRDLADADSPAWPDDIPVAEKLAIVLCFPGNFPQYHRQVHVRRTGSKVLTRGKLASVVAREVQTFLGKLQTANHDPLRHCGTDIALENLVLVDVQHVSKGSLQPTIAIIVEAN